MILKIKNATTQILNATHVPQLRAILSFNIPSNIYVLKNLPHMRNKPFWLIKKIASQGQTINLLNLQTLTFPTGLVPKVLSFCREKGIPISVQDTRKFLKGTGKNWYCTVIPRDYQVAPIEAGIKNKGGILYMATRSGKTRVAQCITAHFKLPTLFVVKSIELMEQARKSFKQAFPLKKIGLIGSGHYDVQQITVAIIQSLLVDKKDVHKFSPLYDYFDVVFFDELHNFGGQAFFKAAMRFNASYRYGLSVSGDSSILVKYHNGELLRTTIENIPSPKAQLLYVKAYDFKAQKIVWSKLNTVHKHLNARSLWKLTTQAGRELTITEDHSVFKYSNGVIKEALTKDVNVGDYLLLDYKQIIEKQKRQLDLAQFFPSGVCVASPSLKPYILALQEDDLKRAGIKNRLASARHAYMHQSKKGIYMPYALFHGHPSLVKDACYFMDGSNKQLLNKSPSIETLAWLIGFFIGDGWLNDNCVQFAVERDMIQDVQKKLNDMKKVFSNMTILVNDRWKERGSVEITIRHWALFSMIKGLFGKQKAFNKRIPTFLFSASTKARLFFIEGLNDSDGHIAKRSRNRKRVHYTTVSKDLCLDLVEFLKTFNVKASIHRRKPALGGIVRGQQIIGKRVSYVIHYSFAHLYGIYGSREGHTPTKDKVGMLPVKVIKKEMLTEGKTFVYDLSVENNHSFLANDLLVHNSGTPFRMDEAGMCLNALCGEIVARVTTKELEEKGVVYKTKIIMQKNPCPPPFPMSSKDWTKLYAWGVVTNPYRNNLIIKWAKRLHEAGRTVLIIVKELNHGNVIKDALAKTYGQDSVLFMNGKEAKPTRQKSLENFCKGNLPFLIGTKIYNEGIDFVGIENPKITGKSVILGTGGRSKINAIQTTARPTTMEKRKGMASEAIIVDFADTFHATFRKHSLDRFNTYKNVGGFSTVVIDKPEDYTL